MKYSTLLCLLLCLVASAVSAQKTIDEGQITMTLSDIKAEDPMIAEQAKMMGGSKTIVAFNKDYSMMNLNLMEGLVSMKTITELDSGDAKMYMDAMGMKYVIPMSKAEKEKMIKEQAGGSGEFKIDYDKSDTKEIAGYQCHKATISNSANSNSTIECYVTDKINADARVLQGFENVNLKGFPLEYTMGDKAMKMTFTATDFSEDVDASIFKIDESNYEQKSFEEFSKMGMGF